MVIGIDCHHLKDQKGIRRYLLNLLRFWVKEKAIKFILYFQKNDKFDKLVPKSSNFRIKKLSPLFGVSSTALFQHFLLPRAAKKDKADILFSPSYLLPLFYRGKTAVSIHDIIYEAHPEWFNFRGIQDEILLKWTGRQSAKKADIIFTPSEFTKQEIKKFYKIRSSKIVVTSLAPDKIFREKKNEDGLKGIKAKYGLQKEYFLFTAAIFERRCLPETIYAFQKIASKHADFQYLIIGKDYTKLQQIKRIVKRINRLVHRQAIIYKGDFIDEKELARLYRGAYATIYNSLYEGFGLPIIESMASATPVICGNAAVFKEVAGENCFWVRDPRSVNEVARAMETAIKNKTLYRQIQKDGLMRVKQISWEKCATKTLESLRQMNVDYR